MNGFVDKILPKSEGPGGWPRFSLFCWLEMNLAWLALREKKKVLWKTREREEISSGCTNCVPPPPPEVAAPSYIGEQMVRGWVSEGRGCRPPVLTEGRPVRIEIGPEGGKKRSDIAAGGFFALIKTRCQKGVDR